MLEPTTNYIKTEILAERIGIKSTSIRVRLCRTGSYFGLRPIKLPNGRLIWPADAVEQLTATRPPGAEVSV